MSKSQKKKQAQAAAAAASKEEEMPSMPIMPDPNVKYLWSGDPSVREFDFKKFIIIWPTYLNADKTIFEGRRIPTKFCCADPNIGELSEICQTLKLRHVIEPYKMYPRDCMAAGRIRVEIFKEDETTLCHPEIKNKKDLLIKMGTLSPLLKSRVRRLEEQAAASQQQLQASSQSNSSGQGSGGGKKGRKKGKK